MSATSPSSSDRELRQPLKPNEQYILDRMRWIDREGKGCFASLDTIRRAATAERWTYSQSQARRLVRRLRQKGYMHFAGCTPSGTNIYVFPDRSYQADKLPVCATRPIHHLWPTTEAERLIQQPLPRGTPFFVEGYPINRKIAATFSESLIRRAVEVIQKIYGPDLTAHGGVKDTSALLRFMCRRIKDAEDRHAAQRRSQGTNAAQTARFERMPEGVRQQLGSMFSGPAKASAPASAPMAPVAPVEPLPPPKPMGALGALFDRWLVQTRHLKAETADFYVWKVRRLQQFFASHDLAELNVDLIAGYIAFRRGHGVKEQTIRKELQTLAVIAGEHGRDLRSEPGIARLLGRLKTRSDRRGRPLTYEDYLALRQELPAHRRAALDVAVYTGARRSELFGLLTTDVDLRNKLLHIRGTKTAGSDRYIPLLAPVEAVVVGLKAGDPVVERWSMAHTDLKQACERAGLEPRSLIDLRHTFASWLKNAGVDSWLVGRLMGHSGSQMVDGTYAHTFVPTLREAMATLPTGPPRAGPPASAHASAAVPALPSSVRPSRP